MAKVSTENLSSDVLSEEEIINMAIKSSEENKFRIVTPTPVIKINTHERYETLPVRSVHEQFLHDAVSLILNTAVFNDLKRENKVLEWRQPEELKQILDLALKPDGDSDEKLLSLIADTIRYSVKTGHPYFVNQLFSCLDPYALAGQWLTDALNPSVYTYEVSPVFVLMEEVVLREMRTIVGWHDGKGDGLFSPGGSMSNGYGINCARFNCLPDVKVNILIYPLICK